jgi:VCBS repeat-containing protein
MISYDAVIGSPDQVYNVKVTAADDGVPARSSFVNFDWTVTNTNRPPSANDDEYSTTEGQDLNVPAPGVLDNDSDLDVQDITAELVSSPDHGGLSLSANGSVSYTPDPDFSGMDAFTYRAIDAEDAQSNVATVTITVENINDPPVAQNQSLETDEDVPLPFTLPVQDPDTGDVLSYTILNPPDHGTLSGAAPDLTYTPDLNYFGTDSFTFKANDGTVDSNQATVSFTVSAVNDLEVTNPGSQISNEEESISLRIQVVDAEGDSLSFEMSGAPPALSIDENTGLITGKINKGASQSSPYQVSVTVSDGIDSVPVTFSWFVDEKTLLFLPMVTTK